MQFFIILLIISGFLLAVNAGHITPVYADDHYITISEDGVLFNENCKPLTSSYFANQIPLTATNTCLDLKIDYGSAVGHIRVMPDLETGKRSAMWFQDVIEISIDGKYQDTIETLRWTEFNVENAKKVTATFPEQPSPANKDLIYHSSEVELIISDVLSEDVLYGEELFNKNLEERLEQELLEKEKLERKLQEQERVLEEFYEESTPEENFMNFINSVDWISVIIGLAIGAVMEIITEVLPDKRHKLKPLKIIKKIIFIGIALWLIISYLISEENTISDNMEIFDPATLVTFGNPNHLLFGVLVAYIAGWIYEIVHYIDEQRQKKKKKKEKNFNSNT